MDRNELIERLEAAGGGDNRLNDEIAALEGWRLDWPDGSAAFKVWRAPSGHWGNRPSYTHSLDDALTLAPTAPVPDITPGR